MVEISSLIGVHSSAFATSPVSGYCSANGSSSGQTAIAQNPRALQREYRSTHATHAPHGE